MAPSGPGLNALIAQCRRLEAALRDEAGAPDTSVMLRWFEQVDDQWRARPELRAAILFDSET